MFKRVLLIAASAALLGFAPAPFPRAERQRGEDQTDVGGTWAFVLWERNGTRERHSEEGFSAKVTKERFELLAKTGGHQEIFSMRLEPGSPPAFTWRMNDAVVFVGSYRLRKDEMTMIFSRGERLAGRPTNFAGECDFRFVLRRVGR